MRPTRESGVRADIQSLRAFAVAAVVLFHFWPGVVPGGYVGVDIFFVISGYLITGQLLRRREETGRIGLPGFWAARARRLLPASLLVLAVSIVLTLVWAPAVLQSQYLRSIIGSALYVENWVLAADAVDYLAAENAPPIAQHYWSLSVEEQFYVFWPLLLIAATAGAAAVAVRRRRALWTIAGVTVLGIAASVWLTTANPPYGYFATPSRVWEFGLGALLALIPAISVPATIRVMLWVAGWAAMIATAFVYDESTAFPGFAALVPTLGAAAVIAVGPSIPLRGVDRLVAWRPVQWVGDQSYGIYLWHWPLIVIAPFVLGSTPDLPQRVVLLVLTVVAAALAKRFVEDPIRFSRATRTLRPRWIGVATVAAMAVVVAAAVAPIAVATQRAEAQEEGVESELIDPSSCRGASAMLLEGCDPQDAPPVAAEDLVPNPATLLEDTGGAYACYDQEPLPEPSVCSHGSTDPDAPRIAVTGDSHAAMLLPGLIAEAERYGWRIDSIVGRGCVWQAVEDPAAQCAERRTAINEILLTGGYDAIVTTAINSPDYDEAMQATIGANMASAWSAAEDAGIRVIPVADNPRVPQSSADCLATTRTFSFTTCAFAPAPEHTAGDPLRRAAEATGAPLLDFGDAFCADEVCPMVVGGVVVYRDLHHITAAFSKTLGPYLAEEIDTIISSP